MYFVFNDGRGWLTWGKVVPARNVVGIEIGAHVLNGTVLVEFNHIFNRTRAVIFSLSLDKVKVPNAWVRCAFGNDLI